eukprot:3589620-Pleurochrysis_carterae.AAC.3
MPRLCLTVSCALHITPGSLQQYVLYAVHERDRAVACDRHLHARQSKAFGKTKKISHASAVLLFLVNIWAEQRYPKLKESGQLCCMRFEH